MNTLFLINHINHLILFQKWVRIPSRRTATLLLLTILIAGCNRTLESNPSSDYLFIVLDDRSGSTSSQAHPSLEKYEKFINGIIKNPAGGLLKVIPVGNIKKEHNQTMQGRFRGLLPIPTTALLSEKGRLIRENEAIRKGNEQTKKDLLNLLDVRVIHYQPANDNDFTNLEEPFKRAVQILNDQSFAFHQKHLIIISDGKHEDKNGKLQSLPICLDDLNIPQFSLYLIGWNQAKNCLTEFDLHEPESFEDLLINLHFLD